MGLHTRPLLVALAFVGALCLFYNEVIFQGRTFLPLGLGYGGVMAREGPWQFPGPVREDLYRWDKGASSWQIEPHARAIGRAYTSGTFPLWNSHQGFGVPLLGNAQSGGLDLLRLPVFISGHPLVWDLYYLARMLLGLALAYLFARGIGLSRWPAVYLALAYTFSGFMLLMGNNHFVEVYLLLPAVLWGTDLLLGTARPLSGKRSFPSPANGGPRETSGGPGGRQPPRRREFSPLPSGRGAGGIGNLNIISGLVVLALAVAASTLAGMPECTLLTFLYAASYGAFRLVAQGLAQRSWSWTLRAGLYLLLAWLIGVGLSAPMIVPLAEYIAESWHIHTPDIGLGLAAEPVARIASLGIPYLEGLPARHVVTGAPVGTKYFTGAVPLALAAAGAFLLWRTHGITRQAGAFALLSGLFWAGKLYGAPVVNEIGRLPMLNLTLIKDWGGPLVSLSAALLGGVALQAVADRRASLWAVGGGLLAFAAYLGTSASLNADLLATVSADHLWTTLGLAAGAGTAAMLTLAVGSRVHRTASLAGAICCAVVALELFALAPRGVYQQRYDPLTEPPFVTFLRQEAADAPPFRVFGRDGLLYPNLATAFGLDDIRAVDALHPRRYFQYVRTFIAPVTDRFTGEPSARISLVDNRWLNLANVAYIVNPHGIPLDEQAPQRAAEALPPVYSGEVEIRANPSALPRAFLVGQAESVPDEAAAIATMQGDTFDPAHVAVVEGPLPRSLTLDGDRNLSGSATIRTYDDQRVEILTQAARPSLLVLTDVFYPGWRATVDGVEAPIHPTNLAFRGVVLEPGSHTVEFTYAPDSFRQGLLYAALALVVLLLAFTFLLRASPSSVRLLVG